MIYIKIFIFVFSVIIVPLLLKKNIKSALVSLYLGFVAISSGFLLYPVWGESAKILCFYISLFLSVLTIAFKSKYINIIQKIKLLHPLIYYIQTGLTIMICFGILEFATDALSKMKVISLYSPMKIEERRASDDWRYAHITGEKSKIPDPILFWKPAPVFPYNREGFKGDEYPIKKSRDNVRIFIYGDSNTDGPDTLYWAEYLKRYLFERVNGNYQIYNAGVAGWTSYQGLKKFLIERKTYNPDIVFVSFGWNDAAYTSGIEDKQYQMPSMSTVKLQRFLYRYKFVLFILNLKTKENAQRITVGIPRVSLEDYRENIKSFYEECKSNGVRVIFLTRPYKYRTDSLMMSETFRKNVPAYNQTLISFCDSVKAEYIDVRKIFEENHRDLFIDESHFNNLGNIKMSEILFDYLTNPQH